MQVISQWEVYWITRLDYFHNLFTALSVLGGVISIVILFCSFDESEKKKDRDDMKEFLLKRLVPLTFLFILLTCLVPSTKEFVAIKVIPAVANNENVQGISKELVDISKEWLDELRPSKEDQ